MGWVNEVIGHLIEQVHKCRFGVYSVGIEVPVEIQSLVLLTKDQNLGNMNDTERNSIMSDLICNIHLNENIKLADRLIDLLLLDQTGKDVGHPIIENIIKQ